MRQKSTCVHYSDLFAGLVNCTGPKVSRDDIIDNTVATSLRSEAEGDRSLDRLLDVEGKGVGWRLLEVVRKIRGALRLDRHLGDGDVGDEG